MGDELQSGPESFGQGRPGRGLVEQLSELREEVVRPPAKQVLKIGVGRAGGLQEVDCGHHVTRLDQGFQTFQSGGVGFQPEAPLPQALAADNPIGCAHAGSFLLSVLARKVTIPSVKWPEVPILERLLAEHQPVTVDKAGWRNAGVLIPVLATGSGYRLVFIRRSLNLRKHAGQIAFPGGAWEEGDQDLLATALRETHEEIGLPPHQVKVLGRVDEVWTPTGYTLTPYVGVIEAEDFVPCPIEVDEVVVVDLDELVQPDVFREEWWERGGVNYRVVFYELPEVTIWGATGRILEGFLKVACGAGRGA